MNKLNKIILFTVLGFAVVIGILLMGIKLPESTRAYAPVVYDSNNQILSARTSFDEEQWYFEPVEVLNQKYVSALIVQEDKRFYYHPGFDPVAVLRAMFKNLKSGRVVQGGSTLTQQLARILRKNPKRTLYEKLHELFIAVKLDLKYSKNEILSMYANQVPMGGNIIGLHAASWKYYGTSVNELTWAQAAMFSVLPNAPGVVHIGSNRKTLLYKRNLLLRKLQQRQIITQEALDLALLEPLPSKLHHLPQNEQHLLKPGSHKTWIDATIQNKNIELLRFHNGRLRSQGIENLAMMTVDLNTGKVLSYIANSYNRSSNSHAVDMLKSLRSPGSTLKPFLYQALIESGDILPESIIPNVPVEYNGFRPQNSNKDFNGIVTVKESLKQSLNVPAVILLYRYSYKKLFKRLKFLGFGFREQKAEHYGLSLILGGAPATAIELAQSYLHLSSAAKGLERYPGLRLFQDSEEKKNKVLLQADAAFLTQEMMKELNLPLEYQSTGVLEKEKTIAWKTGTSYGHKDAWAIGFNKHYLTLVWVGNASGEGAKDLTGYKTAAPIMFDVFAQLPQKKDTSAVFLPQQGLICSKSGFLAQQNCQDTHLGWVTPKSSQTECMFCNSVYVQDDGKRAYQHCKTSSLKQEKLFILPQRWLAYSSGFHKSDVMPLWSEKCIGEITQTERFAIISPQVDSVLLPRELNGRREALSVKVYHQKKNQTLHWTVNDKYVTSTKNEHHHHQQLNLSSGKNVLRVMDQDGVELIKPLCIMYQENSSECGPGF